MISHLWIKHVRELSCYESYVTSADLISSDHSDWSKNAYLKQYFSLLFVFMS